MEFWKNDLKFWSQLYFKLIIDISDYSDAIQIQKEEEKEKVKENSGKRLIWDKMQELKEKKWKIQLKKQKEREGIEEKIHELITKLIVYAILLWIIALLLLKYYFEREKIIFHKKIWNTDK